GGSRHRRCDARGQRQGDRDLPRNVRGREAGPPGLPPMVIRWRPLAAAVLAVLASAAASRATAAASIEEKTVASRGKKRTYALYVPESVKADANAPLLVAIHGSTSNGRTIVERWKDMADAKGFIVAGPDATDNARWASPQDGPLFLKDVVDDVA